MRVTLLAPVLALALAGNLGCGGSSGAPANGPDATQRANAAMATRLTGTWRLADYRPEVPLEPTLQLLLSSQIQTMQVRFEGGVLYADSPAIHVQRAYVVSDVAGSIFKLRAVDQNGVAVTSSAQISDDSTQIMFRGESEPWRGSGVLRRAF